MIRFRNGKTLTTVLSGHTHYGSPYETYSDCGNCEGARCHRCEELYKVYRRETDTIVYLGSSREKAFEYLEED